MLKTTLYGVLLMMGLINTGLLNAQPNVKDSILKRGIEKFKAEDYKGAIEVLQQGVHEATTPPDVHYYLAESQMATGHNRGAMKNYNKVISLDSTYYKAYKNRGKLKAKLGDYRGSISDFNQAIALKPDYSAAYFNRALSKYHLENYEGAITDLNKVLEYTPEDGEVYYWRGRIKIKQEQIEEGCADLSKAGELGYFNAYDSIKKYCN